MRAERPARGAARRLLHQATEWEGSFRRIYARTIRGRFAGGHRRDDCPAAVPRREALGGVRPGGCVVVFSRKQPKDESGRAEVQSALVEMLLETNELGRRRLLLMALQTGELRKSEAPELLRLVDRLESVTGHRN